LGAFLFSGEDAEKKISVLSGGERARLALAIMILKQSNLIIMDEPTNHLDIISKNVLKDALLRFHGTLIVVSHDRDFLAGLTNKVYEFKNQNITEYLGDINYFLEKKKMDDMREIQTLKNKHKLATKIETGNEGIDRKEQKQLKRRLQYVERDMEKVESKMKEIEQMMLDPAFYQNPEFEQKNQTYLNLKEKHEHLNLEWEELAEKIIE
jgi:ATP-binding cassette subfamily F protein 3